MPNYNQSQNKEKRNVRRMSLISPWGVGAIVPFPKSESLMIAGLDRWHYPDKKSFLINDERLIKRLNIKELRNPPDFREKNVDPKNYNLTVPAIRFPTWFYCPNCGKMYHSNYYENHPVCSGSNWEKGKKCEPNAKKKNRLVPERFVVICSNGHIDDFPVAEWVHRKSGKTYEPRKCILRRSTGGSTSNLSSVKYTCTCGAEASLAGAKNAGSLAKIGYRCRCCKPWLEMPTSIL